MDFQLITNLVSLNLGETAPLSCSMHIKQTFRSQKKTQQLGLFVFVLDLLPFFYLFFFTSSCGFVVLKEAFVHLGKVVASTSRKVSFLIN